MKNKWEKMLCSSPTLSLLQWRTQTTYLLYLWGSSFPHVLAEKNLEPTLNVEQNHAGSLCGMCVHDNAPQQAEKQPEPRLTLLYLVTETLIRLCSSARTSGCFGQCQHRENEKSALLSNLPWETSSPITSRGCLEGSWSCMWFVRRYLTA